MATPLSVRKFSDNSIAARLRLDTTLFLGMLQATTVVPDFHLTLKEDD